MNFPRPFGSLAFALSLNLLQIYCFAQDKSGSAFGKVVVSDFAISPPGLVDSNTSAILLSDIGSVHFIGNNKSWFSYVYKRQTRIKILDKKAFDLATIKISLFSQDQDAEKLDKLEASTYNLENGQVQQTSLDKKDIFPDRLDKNRLETKFTMPAVKEGSIIEYTYTITSDFDFNLPSWEFQSERFPTVWSEYSVSIPQALFYVFVRQGVHGYALDKGSQGSESYLLTRKPDENRFGVQDDRISVTAVTVQHRWAMKDIPAFHEEQYLSTPANYIDKIDFQLSKTYDGENYHDVSNSWTKATEELLQRGDFGASLTTGDNDWLSDYAGKIDPGKTGDLEEAKQLYYYVSSHFTCTDHYNKYIKTSLKEVVKKNSGTVGDINLLLVALLRKKGMEADPVVLSTREFGFNLASYPVLGRLNYVIVRVKLSGKIYYLDAANPQLGFGQLAGNCYNGHARIISDKDSGSIYFNADSLKEKKRTLVLLSATDKGLAGSWQSTLGSQESYNLRRRISEQGEKTYFSDVQAAYGEDAEISNGSIDSLTRLEDPVKVQYEFRVKQAPGAAILYLNPLWDERLRDNPFKAIERKYPVEMPYSMDNSYILNMEIPEGYMIDEMPTSAKVVFNGDQGLFEYLIAAQGNTIQLRCNLRMYKSYFPPEDYGNLRDFFSFIVKKESEEIVLKKK